jgi:RNA polymerase sigma-54 factor
MQTQAMAMAPQLAMRPSRVLVAAMELLALTTLEVEQLVDRELAVNPALERREPSRCPLCGAELTGERCAACVPERYHAAPSSPELGLQAEPTLAETLRTEVHLQLAPRDHPIAEYVPGCLDEHGFIDGAVDDVAGTLGVERDRVAAVVQAIQLAGPPGVGARDVRECLLLQLAADSACDARQRDLAREIVAHNFDALGRGRYGAIARELHVERREVLAARDLIRARLRPYPTLPAPEAWTRSQPIVAPEIVVHERGGRRGAFSVELLEPRRLGLVISPSYERVDRATLAPDERAQLEAHVTRARSFVHRLDRRWMTIQAVAELIVERQSEFLLRGPRALEPMTRGQVAESLGFHESTVSRAVAGRHALLPSRRVVALAAFFDAAAGPRDALAHVVWAESRALSDSELAVELGRAGFPIARRTVAKYRDQLGIPAQSLR